MPQAKFRQILRSLKDHDVRFIVVGGLASVLNGAPINTFDLDIVPDRDPENLDRLLKVLDGLDAIYRIQPHRRFKPNISHLLSPGHQNLMTNCGALDVLGTIGTGLTYDDLLPHTIEVAVVADLRVSVLGLAKIIELKEELRRDKDLAMLPTLRQTLKEKQRGPG
jgi:hypothetical protein